MRSIALILSAGISAVALPAQHVVSPTGLTNSYGGINNSIPWGGFQSAEQFYQQASSGKKELLFLVNSGHMIPFDYQWEDVVRRIKDFVRP